MGRLTFGSEMDIAFGDRILLRDTQFHSRAANAFFATPRCNPEMPRPFQSVLQLVMHVRDKPSGAGEGFCPLSASLGLPPAMRCELYRDSQGSVAFRRDAYPLQGVRVHLFSYEIRRTIR